MRRRRAVVWVAGERSRTVAVRLTPGEHAAWLAAATSAGRGRLGSWVREAVGALLAARGAGDASAAGGRSSGAQNSVGPPVGVELRRVRGELARVGSNLNQAVRLAHVAQQAGDVDTGTAARLEAAVAATRELLRQVHADLVAAGTTSSSSSWSRSREQGVTSGAVVVPAAATAPLPGTADGVDADVDADGDAAAVQASSAAGAAGAAR